MATITISAPSLVLLLLLLITLSSWAYLQGAQKAPLWREALKRIPLGIALYEKNGTEVFANELAKTLISQLPAGMIERAHQVRVQGQLHATDVQGKEDGRISLQAWALGNGTLFVIQKTTEENNDQKSARESDRNFISHVAHDMFKPLTTIGDSLDNATNEKLTPDQRRVVLNKAQKQIENLKNLVFNVRTLHQIDSGQNFQPRLYDILDIVDETVDILDEQAKAIHVSVMIEADPKLPPVKIDVPIWRAIFLNLITNSLKYGRQGGTVRVEVRNKISELSISVADDGPGIPADELPHLFKETYRGKAHRDDGEGSGLGLAIVERGVKQHGGQIYCESEPGRGTTFYMSLPLEH
jgi:signal transduction histidine kinase